MIAYLVKGNMITIKQMFELLKIHGLSTPSDIKNYINTKFPRTKSKGYPSNEERREWALTFYREVFKEALKEAKENLRQTVVNDTLKGLSMEISQDDKRICINELTQDQVIGRDQYCEEVTLDITDLSTSNLCDIAERTRHYYLYGYQKLDNIMSVDEREDCVTEGIHIDVYKAVSSYIIGYPIMKTQSVSSTHLSHNNADEFVLNWFLDYCEKEEERETFLILSDERK